MFVHLIVSGENVVIHFDLFVPAAPVAEQTQIPTRKVTAVIDPATQEPEPAVQIKSIHVSAANSKADFAFQLGCDAFVGVDNQHPFMSPGNIFQCPVFFSWEFSVPGELNHLRPGGSRDFLCSIRAGGINQNDFICERNAGKTIAQVCPFILNRHKHG